ncbi:RNA polymerase sigma factor [Sneathiella chinensis]|uniref:RNA polymerase subunit sigma-70 n=1 Tax=Sneathiella chinensis TaxID=349750 RepID=A0ABQ5U6R5_9PROT|nr:RNA polymerase sigma factor [Sneathiella chinensis]GLQ07002.1 hypothetical protein GCM10007924_22230 [Sneathiella chinensis]
MIILFNYKYSAKYGYGKPLYSPSRLLFSPLGRDVFLLVKPGNLLLYLGMSLRKKILLLLPELKAYATALSKNGDLADDLAQEAVKNALSAKRVPEDIRDLRPWMFRIIRNLYIDGLRKDRVRSEYSSDQARLLSECEPHTPTVIEEILVRQALTQVSATDREILYLIDVLGLKYAEAAVVLDIPQGTVMSRISRARRAMLSRIEETNIRPFEPRVKSSGNGNN